MKTNNFNGLYPFRSNHIEINTLKYHYIDEGDGDPVVMVHGNPTWSFFFRNIIKELSLKYRVIAPDHMGCGLSDKPDPSQYDFSLKRRVLDLEYLLDYLGIDENITLIMHDWGGMIGLCYALKHTKRISRLIITNTAGFLPPGKKTIPLRLRIIRNISFFAKPAVLGLNIFARAAIYMAPCKKLAKDVKKGLLAPYDRPGHRWATLEFVKDIPLRPKDKSYHLVLWVDNNLNKLEHLPMLICWGKDDFVFDLDYFKEWQKRFPNAEICFFEDAGHYLFEDKPDEIAACIKKFMEKHKNTHKEVPY